MQIRAYIKYTLQKMKPADWGAHRVVSAFQAGGTAASGWWLLRATFPLPPSG